MINTCNVKILKLNVINKLYVFKICKKLKIESISSLERVRENKVGSLVQR